MHIILNSIKIGAVIVFFIFLALVAYISMSTGVDSRTKYPYADQVQPTSTVQDTSVPITPCAPDCGSSAN